MTQDPQKILAKSVTQAVLGALARGEDNLAIYKAVESVLSSERLAATGKMEESGWLIELGESSPSRPSYFMGPSLENARQWPFAMWTDDHLKAIRFARKIDAETIAGFMKADAVYDARAEFRIAEHSWSNFSTTTAPAGGDVRKALKAVIKFVGKQEPDKLPDELLYGMLGVETMCRHALAALPPQETASPSFDRTNEPQTLWGMIAAIYGDIDAEDCAMVDREWARMRGYILPANGTSTLVSSTDSQPPKAWLEAKAEIDAGWPDDKAVSSTNQRPPQAWLDAKAEIDAGWPDESTMTSTDGKAQP